METKKINYINWWKQTPSDGKAAEPITQSEQFVPTQQGGTGTPFIQPLVVVPYLSADQPMYHYDPSATAQAEPEHDAQYYEDLFDDEESYALPDGTQQIAKREKKAPVKGGAVSEKAVAERKEGAKMRRRANGNAIVTFILGLVYVAMAFDLTKLISTFNYNVLYDGKVAFNVIEELVRSVIDKSFVFAVDTTLLPILVTAGALFTAITLLFSLFTVASRTNVFVKVIATLAFLLNAGAAVVAFVVNKVPFETYGLVIFAGISFLMFLFTIVAKGKRRRR